MYTKTAAAAYRKEKAGELFKREILNITQSISLDEDLIYHGTKSDILKKFYKCHIPVVHSCSNSAIIIELSAIIYFMASVNAKTFHDSATKVYKHIQNVFKLPKNHCCSIKREMKEELDLVASFLVKVNFHEILKPIF